MQQYCQSLGGELVSINREEKNEFVYHLCGKVETNTTGDLSSCIVRNKSSMVYLIMVTRLHRNKYFYINCCPQIHSSFLARSGPGARGTSGSENTEPYLEWSDRESNQISRFKLAVTDAF